MVPSFFADAEGQDGKQDEKAVGPEQRHGVVDERAFGDVPCFGKAVDVTEIGLVDHIKCGLQDDEAKVGKQKPKYQRCDIVFPKCAFVMVYGFLIHGVMCHLSPQK